MRFFGKYTVRSGETVAVLAASAGAASRGGAQPTQVRLAVFAVLALAVVAIALVAPAIVPYDPYAQDLAAALQPPSADHLAGTDRYGRDLLSRIIVGAQSSVFSTLALVVIAAVLGTAVGMAAGWRGGVLDTAIMRLSDLFLAFPGLVFALAVAAVLGGGMRNAVIALAAISWPKYARIARGLTLEQRKEGYVDAARLAGCSSVRLVMGHVLHNVAGPLVVTAALDTGTMMIELAGLSFLGLGAQPPLAEWGSMMSDSRSLLQTAPWTVMAPGIAMVVAVAVFNLLGDALRDWMDPRRDVGYRGREEAGAAFAGGASQETGAGVPRQAAAPASRSRFASRQGGRTLSRRALIAFAGIAAAAAIGAAAFGLRTAASRDGASGTAPASGGGVRAKRLVYGTTGYGVEMDDAGLNPHEAYSGWSAVRYGVGEALFKFNDAMEPEPWLATGYEFADSTHCTIALREGVRFSSGRAMDGQAVKECLEHLVAVHDRAAADLKIAGISAEAGSITVETSEPCPALVNYLCDPYGAIIDMQAGATEAGNVSGTGPYRAVEVSDTQITLVPNADYWGGVPKLDQVVVRSITNGDTLASALQSGEIDAAYGMAYASYRLFEDEGSFRIESCDTSRTFFGQANWSSSVMQDAAVREALALGIDKQGFIETLLNGRGVAAVGPFTDDMAFGDGTVSAEPYDPERAKQVLEAAGWTDADGDGVREKDGRKLAVRWLTYPGRMELPLLAEYAQATLGAIGFDIQVNSTANHTEIRNDRSAWDVYVSALVTAPTGDPEYFFGASCLTGAAANYGGYSNPELDALGAQLHAAFDAGERAQLATRMQQLILDDHAYFFASHLTMGIVARVGVCGIEPHPCDYYEITVDLDVE